MVPHWLVQILHPPQWFENPTIDIFRRSVKENNYSNKTSRFVHDISLYKLYLSNGSWVAAIKKNINRPPCSYFPFLTKMVLLKVVHPPKIIRIQNFMVVHWVLQVLRSPQKCEHLPFWNGYSYSIKNYGMKASFSGITSLLNFIKIYQLGQKLIRGEHRQDGDLISLHFFFRKESRLIK
jgi:hypothetical protein